MKTILIVEDTQENLEAAKAYFSTIPGFEFVYATNRKEAEEFLPISYAVITDRNMPYEGIPKPDFYEIENGYHIAVSAKVAGKPVIMITEHGELALGYVNADNPNFSKAAELVAQFSGRKMTSDERGQLSGVTHIGGVFYLNFTHRVSKKSQKAWEMAWQELCKQF